MTHLITASLTDGADDGNKLVRRRHSSRTYKQSSEPYSATSDIGSYKPLPDNPDKLYLINVYSEEFKQLSAKEKARQFWRHLTISNEEISDESTVTASARQSRAERIADAYAIIKDLNRVVTLGTFTALIGIFLLDAVLAGMFPFFVLIQFSLELPVHLHDIYETVTGKAADVDGKPLATTLLKKIGLVALKILYLTALAGAAVALILSVPLGLPAFTPAIFMITAFSSIITEAVIRTRFWNVVRRGFQVVANKFKTLVGIEVNSENNKNVANKSVANKALKTATIMKLVGLAVSGAIFLLIPVPGPHTIAGAVMLSCAAALLISEIGTKLYSFFKGKTEGAVPVATDDVNQVTDDTPEPSPSSTATVVPSLLNADASRTDAQAAADSMKSISDTNGSSTGTVDLRADSTNNHNSDSADTQQLKGNKLVSKQFAQPSAATLLGKFDLDLFGPSDQLNRASKAELAEQAEADAELFRPESLSAAVAA